MFSSTEPYVKPLQNNLVLKSLSTTDEIERLAVFNITIHGEEHLDDMTRSLILHHPYTHPRHWLFVEDEATGEIVSTVALLPWTWRYEDITLNAAEMGIVGTHEAFRQRGLIRALVERFKHLLEVENFDLSHIQGIPYFYRQFGYEYALPLEGGWEMRLDQVPGELPEQARRFSFRQAILADVPTLMAFYDEAMTDLDISGVRSEAIWRYLLEFEPDTASASQTWLVLDPDDHPVGYWRIERLGFGYGLTVGETSRLSHAAAMAALGKSRALAVERDKPYLRLSCADSSPLVSTARAWGAHSTGRYAWQIHVPDEARFLRKIAPVLERRIAASPFAGLTEALRINLFRHALEIRFQQGKIADVQSIGFQDGEGLSIPPLLFAPLVLGHRSREELHQAFPDVSIWGQSQYLVDVLFPKMSAFIYAAY